MERPPAHSLPGSPLQSPAVRGQTPAVLVEGACQQPARSVRDRIRHLWESSVTVDVALPPWVLVSSSVKSGIVSSTLRDRGEDEMRTSRAPRTYLPAPRLPSQTGLQAGLSEGEPDGPGKWAWGLCRTLHWSPFSVKFPWLCDPGQDTRPLCASVYSPCVTR